MLLWKVIALSLILTARTSVVDIGPSNERILDIEALNAILEATPRHQDFLLLFKEQNTVFGGVNELQAPGGVALFEVGGSGPEANRTWTQISHVGALARQLRQVTWSVTVLVVSDDPVFLATFANWTLRGHMLVWATRLLVLTHLPLNHLHGIRNTLSVTNSMLLHVSQTVPLRVNVYIDMPYRPIQTKGLPVATWSHDSGLQQVAGYSFYPDKFVMFPNGARLSVARVIRSMDQLKAVEDPGAPGGQKIIVQSAENALFEAVAQSLNLSITYLAPADDHWGMRLPDGTWTGMVGMVYRQEADIGLGLFTMTPIRHEAVDFTHPVTIVFVSPFAARGSPEVDPWSFLLPLTPLVWIVLLTSLLGMVTVTLLLLYCIQYNTLTWTHVQSSSASFIRVLLIQDMYEFTGWWWWERVILGVWMLMTLVMTKSYEGNLISQLAVRYVPQPLQTLEDILESTVTLIIPEGTSDEEAFRTAKGGIYREIWELREEGRIEQMTIGETAKHLPILRKGDSVHIIIATESMMKMSRQFAVTGECEFYLGRGEYLASLESMAVAKGSSLLPSLSRKVMQVAEGGLYWYWYQLYYPNLTSCLNAPTMFAIKSPLAIRNIWGMFVILGGGVAASVVVFILERLCYHISPTTILKQ